MNKLEQLKVALAAATKERWHRNIPPAKKYNTIFAGRNTHVLHLDVRGLTDEEIEGNCDLVVLAKNTLPDLIAAVEALEPLLTSFGDLRSGFPERELHEPADVTADRAFHALAKLKEEACTPKS